MTIKEIDRNKNEINEPIFSSFEEVFSYCLEDVSKLRPLGDDVLYGFKVLDTDEIFYIHGTPKGEDSEIYKEILFR